MFFFFFKHHTAFRRVLGMVGRWGGDLGRRGIWEQFGTTKQTPKSHLLQIKQKQTWRERSKLAHRLDGGQTGWQKGQWRQRHQQRPKNWTVGFYSCIACPTPAHIFFFFGKWRSFRFEYVWNLRPHEKGKTGMGTQLQSAKLNVYLVMKLGTSTSSILGMA